MNTDVKKEKRCDLHWDESDKGYVDYQGVFYYLDSSKMTKDEALFALRKSLTCAHCLECHSCEEALICSKEGKNMIVCSAIKFSYNNYPIIICGKRHGDCIKSMSDFSSIKIIDRKNIVQGFLTDDNKFLDRKQAALYAYQNGQVEELSETLISEDLW